MDITSYEREALLDDIEGIFEKDDNITIGLLLSITAVVMLVLFLFMPKIYLSNNIYQTSITIEKLKKTYLSLKNENTILKGKIAKMKYKNGVTH
jgi:cell division protein FtsB